MSLGSYNTISVGSTATLIIASNPERKGLNIYNNGTQTMYIGPDANITTANAMPILPNSPFDTENYWGAYRGPVYGIVASSTLDCRYWEWI